jgi:hypothetical protein
MLQKIFRRGRRMRLGLTIVLSGVWAVTLGGSQSQAKPLDPPVLSVVLDDAITQPGNLRLIRPLVLFIADWSSQSPRARAWTNTGIVTAEILRIPGSPDHWNASVKYTVVEAPDVKPGSGALTLHLTIEGANVFGSFEGRFRDLRVHGAARAGLTWDLTTDMRHGMLLWLPDPARPARAALL